MTIRRAKKTVDGRVDAVDKGFAEVREQFATVDQRFDVVDKQFVEVREQLAAVGQRFEAVDQRFEAVDRRFEAVDQRLDSLERRVAVEGETSRRHMDVIAEEFRSLVRLGLDRQMATEQQIRQLAASHAVDHAVYTSAIQDHETRLRALEPRDSSADETS